MDGKKKVKVFKSEVIEILKAGPFKIKQALYAMLITSKHEGKIFYFPEARALQMIGTNSKDTVGRTIRRLVGGGFIEYVRKGEVDWIWTQYAGHVRYKSNMYKLLISEPKEDEPYLEVTIDDSFLEIATKLCSKKEVRNYVKRTEFTNRWLTYYKDNCA
ncbi:hypothetical protein [Terribacillus saccharophilus]|uniref:hypothetical protein n=1 Tax=Terribacillus saccharophilus TaxID=361277 RepID=UPI003981CD82